MAPQQKPYRSKQDYQTPLAFIEAAKTLLSIRAFDIDVAASAENAICSVYYDKEQNALAEENRWMVTPRGWSWCNPPYGNIRPWVVKAFAETVQTGARIAMLIPASAGSNWWADYVHGLAYVHFLNGRLGFIPEKPKWLYPKDLALLLYDPMTIRSGGYNTWKWRKNGISE